MAYGSATLSLAALEFLVHADVPRLSAIRLVSCEASWPDDLALDVLDVTVLPRNWRDTPAPPALAAIGDTWARARKTAILVVPSAIVPSENNVLINREHPNAARITFGKPAAFSYDPRLL